METANDSHQTEKLNPGVLRYSFDFVCCYPKFIICYLLFVVYRFDFPFNFVKEYHSKQIP